MLRSSNAILSDSDNPFGKLKEFYGKDAYNDVIINIIEIDDQFTIPNMKRKRNNKALKKRNKYRTCEGNIKSEYRPEYLLCSIPVHRIILASQCEYFKKIFESNMKESKTKKVTLKVNKGNGVYLQILIHSFYDHDIFETMPAYKLLRVMDMADQYCCDSIIHKITDVLQTAKMKGIDECENIAYHLTKKHFGVPKAVKASDNLLKQCAIYVAETVYPLEKNMRLLSKCCQSLPFSLLLSILECKKPLAWHENTILLFICLWFQYDNARQTPDNIDQVLRQIDYTDLTLEFLILFIKERDFVFKSWSKFQEWYDFAMGYNVLSRKTLTSENVKISRNENEVKSCMHKMVKKSNNCYTSNEKPFVFKGFLMSPTFFFMDDKDMPDIYNFGIHIQIQNVGKMFEDIYCDSFIKFTIAIAIYPESMYEPKFLKFSQVKEGNSYSLLYTYNQAHAKKKVYCPIGVIRKDLMKFPNSFNLVLAFKDEGQAWPRNFPKHFTRNQSLDRLNISFEFA